MKSPLLPIALAGLALGLMLTAHGLSRDGSSVAVPHIEGHGAVTPFPHAASQPRDGSKIVVDLTAPGPPDAIHPGIEKLARYVNLYAAGGAKPAKVQIAVVLHGEATELSLDEASYAQTFDVDRNPNLPLLRLLHQAGVQFEVCGQSLTGKGYQPAQVAPPVRVAVSALTAVVNHQHDGYAYVPIAK